MCQIADNLKRLNFHSWCHLSRSRKNPICHICAFKFSSLFNYEEAGSVSIIIQITFQMKYASELSLSARALRLHKVKVKYWRGHYNVWLVGRVRVPLRRAVLRRAPVQRQARVLVRLPRAGRAGDSPQQPRRRLPENTQDMSSRRAIAPHRTALHTLYVFSK